MEPNLAKMELGRNLGGHFRAVTFERPYIWTSLQFMGAATFGRRYISWAPLHLGAVTFHGRRYIWAPLQLTLVTNVRRYI